MRDAGGEVKGCDVAFRGNKKAKVWGGKEARAEEER